jgi:exosome complex RNA-binding protein Rrp42 (RNase PH superfamily)
LLSCEAVKKFEDLQAKYAAYAEEEEEEAPSTAAAKTLLGEAFVTISEAKIIDTILSDCSVKEKKKIDSTLTAVVKYSREFKVKIKSFMQPAVVSEGEGYLLDA